MMSGDPSVEPYDLSPERTHSVQLSFSGTNLIKGVNFEINGFYNNSTDLIMTHVMDYMNAGRNKTIGVELMANYKTPRFTADFNMTWLNTFKANLMGIDLGVLAELANFTSDIDDNNNTPHIMSNLVLAWQATKRLKLHTHLLFEGKQSSYNTDLVRLVQINNCVEASNECAERGDTEEAQAWLQQAIDLMKILIDKKDMSPRAIVNVGAEYKIGNFTFGLNIHNLFGTRYNRSGMNTNLIRQQGRWFMFDVGFRF
jgi:iron complex outermembrane receptor protein